MISSIHIQGYKSLVDNHIPLGAITLLCGLNNSGKSSVLQALRMYARCANDLGPLIPGHGSLDEIRSKLVLPTDTVRINCTFHDGESACFAINATGYLSPEFFPVCAYLSAERLGPRTSLPLEEEFNKQPSVGEHGEYTIGFLDALRTAEVPPALRHKDAQGITLEYQVSAWLNEIAPGAQIRYEVNKKADSSTVQFNEFRAPNSGFGLSYSLPLISIILGAATERAAKPWGNDWDLYWEDRRQQRGVLLLLENPEAHLHPAAQTAMGMLIALGASAGLQIVAETQSEHIMDGIRIAIKNGLLDHTKAVFHYLKKETSGSTSCTTPSISIDGKLSSWPEGFFDQSLKNRMQLAR
jgi:predicted ATPase